MKESKCLIILGMHRSGTSLIAGWLNLCGLHLGDRLMNGGLGNESGHYEDLDFHDLHEDVLRFNNIEYGGYEVERDLEFSDYFNLRFNYIVRLKEQLRSQWGWKEPRTCLFLDKYKEIIPTAKYLIVYRPAELVISSLLNREFKRFEKSQLSSGRWVRWRYLRNKNKTRKLFYEKNMEKYSKAWILYNGNLLNFMNQNSEKCFLVKLDELKGKSNELFEWLIINGFILKKYPIENFLDPQKLTQLAPPLNLKENITDQINNIKEKFLRYT